MMRFDGIRPGVRRLFRIDSRNPKRARADAELELDAMLAARVDHLVARGMSPDAASAEAIRRLGSSVEVARRQLRRSARDREGRLRFDELLVDARQDIGYGIRGLASRPVFTLTVILTLALGIGVATGVFSIVNGVLLRPLPYPDADRIVRVFETAPAAQGGELRSIAIPTLADWREQVRQFDGLALYGPVTFDVAGDERPEQIEGAAASAAFFPILGVRPLLGRTFTADEERPGAPLVVVLGHGLWQRRFGSDSSLIGKTIRLDRKAFTVVGIMPPRFAYPARAELWATLAIDDEYEARAARHMNGLGRLKPGATLAAATDDLLAAQRQLSRVYPENYAERGVRLIPLAEHLVGNVRGTLSVLAGAVTLVLLVACVNVANLQVARGSARRREIAIRRALGASKVRVARQLLIEAMLLFTAAGACGVGVASVVIRVARSFAATMLPRADSVQLDGMVILFAVGVTLVSTIIFGLGPALHGAASMPAASLLDGARGSTSGRSTGRLRSVLIVTETALAAMLLVGAGLLVRSVGELNHVDAGLPTENLLTFRISLPQENGSTAVTPAAFFRDLGERLAALPGVASVAMASRLPLSGSDHSNNFRLLDRRTGATVEHSAQDRAVSPAYFAALGIRIREGREFTDADGATAPPVAIVNASFALRYFPDGGAIGRRFTPSRAGGAEREVIGVVADTRQFGLDAATEPEFYIPHAQDPWPFLDVALRTGPPPFSVLPDVQNAIWSVDRELPLGGVRTMEQMIQEGGARRRVIAAVLAIFALSTYLLATIGLYGVIAYAVTQRTSEIGIRLALGAGQAGVRTAVIRHGVQLAAIGTIAGLAAAVPLTGALRGLLYGVSATDPATFLVVALLVPAIAFIASLIPARRAVRIDPASAMRTG
jgi:putative ABC transport system permease protein